MLSQGFLSDLLKKANREYDEKKLKEYTQTIVSSRFFFIVWFSRLNDEDKKRLFIILKLKAFIFFLKYFTLGVFSEAVFRLIYFFQTVCTVLEAMLCISCILINSAVNLLCVQLRMFDLNGDGKLGLSEMAR